MTFALRNNGIFSARRLVLLFPKSGGRGNEFLNPLPLPMPQNLTQLYDSAWIFHHIPTATSHFHISFDICFENFCLPNLKTPRKETGLALSAHVLFSSDFLPEDALGLILTKELQRDPNGCPARPCSQREGGDDVKIYIRRRRRRSWELESVVWLNTARRPF